MPETERTYVSTKNYDLELKIKDLDYSADLTRVRIISSITGAYQIFYIDLALDPQDILLDGGIFGQDKFSLSVRYISQTEEDGEQVDFELMYVKGDFVSPSKSTLTETAENNKERVPFSVVCVCREPFKTMTTTVNEVYEETTLADIISDLASSKGATVEQDSDGRNNEPIDQVVIPPIPFYKSIMYLDDTFGIFDGPPSIFCQYDNTIQIKNLSKQMNKDQTFTIYHLSTDANDTEEIIGKSLDGKNFYTFEPLETNFQANTKAARLSKNIKHIVKPKDKLFHLIEHDLETIASENGIIFKNDEIQIDENLNERTRYFISDTGYNETESFILSKISKQLANLSVVKLSLDRSMPVHNLIRVGDVVKLETKSADYIEISGKYILHSTDIEFIKERDWDTLVDITLIRTNRII